MTFFPLRLIVKSVVALVIAGLAIQMLMQPLASMTIKKVGECLDYYSSSSKLAVVVVTKRRAALRVLEKKVSTWVNMPGKAASSYEFVQEFLKKRDIQAVKITGGTEESSGAMTKNEFTIEYQGTYHGMGDLVSDFENGPFVCGVKSLHAVSNSPLNNALNIEMTIAFYRSIR